MKKIISVPDARRFQAALAAAQAIVAAYRSEAPAGFDCFNAVTQNRFQDLPCTVVVSNNFDTHGTVTRSTVAHLTPSDLEDLFKPSGKFADMEAWFQTAFEMQMCGIKRNGFYDWLMSSSKQVGHLLVTQPMDRGDSLLFPFIMGRQDSIINREFWAITQGQANSAYTAGVTGPLTAADKALGVAGDRVIRVVSRYGIDLDPNYFLNRDTVFIWNRGGNGVSQRGMWKVLAAEAEVAAHPSYCDVLITSQNSGSSSPWDSAPTSGLVLIGSNNVSDWESFCANRPTADPRHRVPFWYKTYRRIRRVDSEYEKVFARLMESNKYFQNFGDLPLSERNRQDEELFQKAWVNTFLFGKALDANQTLANWQSLPDILSVGGGTVDPGQGGKLVAKRAEIIGVREQLRSCGQQRDLQNNLLNWYEFLDANYQIYRARDSQGKNVDSIDWFTDSTYAGYLLTAMVNYLKAEYGDSVRYVIESSSGKNDLGFSWWTFSPKFPIGVKINIITHKTFDDLVQAAATENITSTARFLLALEIGKPGPKGGSVYPGMIASNRKVRTLGELERLAQIDPTYACTMELPTERITLTSETCCAIVECPANNLWVEGIAEGVPITTGKTQPADYTNLY
jgi:hypothetical protein